MKHADKLILHDNGCSLYVLRESKRVQTRTWYEYEVLGLFADGTIIRRYFSRDDNEITDDYTSYEGFNNLVRSISDGSSAYAKAKYSVKQVMAYTRFSALIKDEKKTSKYVGSIERPDLIFMTVKHNFGSWKDVKETGYTYIGYIKNGAFVGK